MVLFVFAIPLPVVLAENMSLIGNMTTPLALIFIGNSLADAKIAGIFSNWQIWLTCLFRLILIPAVVFFVMYLITDNYYMRVAPTVLSALPVAAMLSIFSHQFDADVALSGQIIFLSTILGMLTLPFVIFAMQMI